LQLIINCVYSDINAINLQPCLLLLLCQAGNAEYQCHFGESTNVTDMLVCMLAPVPFLHISTV